MSFPDLRINAERFRAHFDALAAIGATPEGGVHRTAFSPAHCEARAWFLETAEAGGLTTFVDQAGNHFARLAPAPTPAPAFLIGSHLDSVRNGGRYDGALGVLCALEVAQTLHDAQIPLRHPVEVVDFTDEEGYFLSLLGSRALAGLLDPKELTYPHTSRTEFETALADADLAPANLCKAQRAAETLAGYVEVHIEQGPRLITEGVDIGNVSHIVGIRSFHVTFRGHANHAGTTPMTDRHDAGQGAATFTLAAHELVLKDFPQCTVNVGDMQFAPAAFNIIPETVVLTLECRAPTTAQHDDLETALRRLAHQSAERFRLTVEIAPLSHVRPAPMDAAIQTAIADACAHLGLSQTSLVSGAGHDAQSLATLCPAGMIFIPSVGALSHHPDEFTRWPDCLNAANVLLHTTLAFVAMT